MEVDEEITLPAGTAFRSEAFDDEAPQVFETTEAVEMAPWRNVWTIGPVAQ